MTKIGAAMGYLVRFISSDLGFGEEWDLSMECNVRRVELEAENGLYDGGHGGAPCGSWSAARYANSNGPPPLRSSTFPWGLPSLSREHQRQVDEANVLMLGQWRILRAMHKDGATTSAEHPEDPRREPLPSFWNTKFFEEMKTGMSLSGARFPQCKYESLNYKGTEIWANFESIGEMSGVCTHGWHQSLIGRDFKGRFLTKASQAYPSAMCKHLAELHLKEMMSRQRERQIVDSEELQEEIRASQDYEKGEFMPVPPVETHWDKASRWKTSFIQKWKTPDHINVLEARTILNAMRHKARRNGAMGRRHLVISDSQVSIGSFMKGRSSRPGMNFIMRRYAALAVAMRFKPVVRWIPTKRNLADGPSRGWPIGPAPESIQKRVRMPESSQEMPENFGKLAG